MTWHPRILPLRQQRVLTQLGPLIARHGFYLGGGTAVALYLGHRRSIDLDWFNAHGLPDPLRLANVLREQGVPIIPKEIAPGTLNGTLCCVRVSFFEYRYPLIAGLRRWRRNVRIASLSDLAAMKLAAVAQRGAKKDFIDIYGLGLRFAGLRTMLRCYRDKFATEDVGHLLYGLTYFDDADRERMPRMIWKANWSMIKDTIRRWVHGASYNR